MEFGNYFAAEKCVGGDIFHQVMKSRVSNHEIGLQIFGCEYSHCFRYFFIFLNLSQIVVGKQQQEVVVFLLTSGLSLLQLHLQGIRPGDGDLNYTY